jgi:chemosensory pili system protein ChpC
LPNATVAEVITYSVPEKIAARHPGLLGRLSWRGWRLPLFSFAPVVRTRDRRERQQRESRRCSRRSAAIRKCRSWRCWRRGFPRLTTITPDLLIPTGDESEHPPGVHAQVLVREDQAVIPNLDHIESLVRASTGSLRAGGEGTRGEKKRSALLLMFSPLAPRT